MSPARLPTKKQLESIHADGDAKETLHGNIESRWLRAAVYGANDGIVTTFAVVAGAVGAGLDTRIIVILGIANMVADGLSMGLSDFLGSISENRYKIHQLAMEKHEYEKIPEIEQGEVEQMYIEKGYTPKDAAQLVAIHARNPEHLIELGFREEMGELPQVEGIWRTGVVTFVAFVVAGTLPLAPYIGAYLLHLPIEPDIRLPISVAATGLALFVVGSLRTLLTDDSWIKNGLQVLAVGSIAAMAAYFLGAVIERLIL